MKIKIGIMSYHSLISYRHDVKFKLDQQGRVGDIGG